MLTGVDLDKAALEIRKNVLNDLHEIIEGDLRTVAFDDARFDVIYNAYVLEHIDGAEFVLKRFVDWLKPGGSLILHIPDPNSVQGFVTRISPHWFHVFYYRFILGKTSAGKPGYAPYRTYYDHVVSRSGIRKFCQENKLAIISEVGNAYWKPGRGILKPAIVLFTKFVSIMSFGVLAWQYTNLLYIIQKKGDSRAD